MTESKAMRAAEKIAKRFALLCPEIAIPQIVSIVEAELTAGAFAEGQPLCPVHQSLEDRGKLEVVYGNECIACSLNERVELLNILTPAAPQDGSADTVTVLRNVMDFWNTHQGENRVVVSYPAPAPTASAKCVKCGHNNLSADGRCKESVPICSDSYHGSRECGCKCVFTADKEPTPPPTSRFDIIREQQRSGGSDITAVMVSPTTSPDAVEVESSASGTLTLAQIKEARAGINSELPWIPENCSIKCDDGSYLLSADNAHQDDDYSTFTPGDCVFIANSPAYVDWLIWAYESAREDVEATIDAAMEDSRNHESAIAAAKRDMVASCENCTKMQQALTQVARENRSLEKRCVQLQAEINSAKRDVWEQAIEILTKRFGRQARTVDVIAMFEEARDAALRSHTKEQNENK